MHCQKNVACPFLQVQRASTHYWWEGPAFDHWHCWLNVQNLCCFAGAVPEHIKHRHVANANRCAEVLQGWVMDGSRQGMSSPQYTWQGSHQETTKQHLLASSLICSFKHIDFFPISALTLRLITLLLSFLVLHR